MTVLDQSGLPRCYWDRAAAYIFYGYNFLSGTKHPEHPRSTCSSTRSLTVCHPTPSAVSPLHRSLHPSY